MKKLLVITALLLIFVNVCDAQLARSRGLTYHQISVVDLTGNPITDISTVSIYLPDTTTDATIYSDGGMSNAITLPMTTASTNTTLTQAKGTFSFWGPELFDFSIGNGSVNVSNAFTNAWNSSKGQIVFPYFLRTYDSQALLDAQSITFGTSLDWVANAGAVADTMTFIPATTDTSTFNVGSASYTSDFRVFGATSGYNIIWDASEDTLELLDNVVLAVGTGDDYTISHNGSTTTVAGAHTVSGIPTFSTDVVFDGTYDIKYDDNRNQLHFQDSAVLGIGGAADAAGDFTFSYDASDLLVEAAAADDAFKMGATTNFDFYIYGDTATDYVLFDTSAEDMHMENFSLSFGEGDPILLGAPLGTGDITISSTSNVLTIGQVVAGTGSVVLGVDDAGVDFTLYGDTASQKAWWDASGDQWYFGADAEGVDVTFYADTAGDYVKWDEDSAVEALLFVGADLTLDADSTLTATAIVQVDQVVTDGATYTVTAANSGKIHVIGDLSQNTSIDLPAEADGLNYEFWYVGGAADAHDHTIDSENNTNFFIGGVAFADIDAGDAADEIHVGLYSDGNSNSKLTINNASAGTVVKITCDGTNWYITGQIMSDTAPAFADQ